MELSLLVEENFVRNILVRLQYIAVIHNPDQCLQPTVQKQFWRIMSKEAGVTVSLSSSLQICREIIAQFKKPLSFSANDLGFFQRWDNQPQSIAIADNY